MIKQREHLIKRARGLNCTNWKYSDKRNPKDGAFCIEQLKPIVDCNCKDCNKFNKGDKLMKKEYVYLGFVLDRSGSMANGDKITEARNRFNSMIREKKQNKEFKYDCFVTIFDDIIETLYEGKLKKCPELTKDIFSARGMTSYYDALGITINRIGEVLSSKPEKDRPDKVLITVITDGLENNSKEFTGHKLKELIEHQRNKYNWEFIFMASNEDAIGDAVYNLGFAKNMTFYSANTKEGTGRVYRVLNRTIDAYSSGTFDGYDDKEN